MIVNLLHFIRYIIFRTIFDAYNIVLYFFKKVHTIIAKSCISWYYISNNYYY